MLLVKTERFVHLKTSAPFCHFYREPFKIRHSFISLLLQKLPKAYLMQRTVKAA